MSADPSPVMTIDSLIQNITHPVALESFYDDTKKLRVVLHRPNASDLDIQLPPLFPFMKIYDLKLAIYKHLKEGSIVTDVKIYPEYQFLCISRIKDTRLPVDFRWFLPGSTKPLLLAKPFDLENANRVALNFVDENGTLRNLTLTDKSKILIENQENTDLHLYLYDDMKAGIPADDELSWNKYLHPYFPEFTYGTDTFDKKKTEARYQRFLNMTMLSTNLNEKLKGVDLHIQFTGVRRLQMRWVADEKINIENLFYSTPVTIDRPYMRLMPNKGISITKLHLQEDNTPDADLARVLKQWTRERNPNPENDYIMAKTVIRGGLSAQDYPIYMTLRFGYSNNQSYADATLQPPKGVRKLDTLFTDTHVNEKKQLVNKFVYQFGKGIEKLPYTSLPLVLENATLIYEIQLAPTPVFTKGTLKLRLPKFLPFFQEIPPLPGDQPIAMLRYKCVDNFTNENRISSFLTQYANLKLIKGETDTAILSVLEDEFQLDTRAAQEILSKWLKGRGDLEIIDTNETVESKNTGIDIAIFAKHPFFHFHLHNVSSLKALQQVLTLLSILFRASDADLHMSSRAVEKIKAAEAAVVHLEREEEEKVEVVADEDQTPDENDDYWKQFAAVDGDAPLEEEVRNEFLSAQEDLAAAIPAPAPMAAAQVAEDEEELAARGPPEDGKIEADFFLQKLKEADKKLFDYTKTHPSLKKYVSMCAANVTRQPAVLRVDQINEMKREYSKELEAENPTIAFVFFPLNKGEKPLTRPENSYQEVFFFLAYGTTDVKNTTNYYVCSKYFCGRDEIIILERDFKGTTLRRPVIEEGGRQRTTKAPNTCPFCEGKPVVNRRNPGLNETVLVRQDAPKTQGGIYHKYVGFLKKTPHPDGFHLPCCFIDNTLVYKTDKYYDRYQTQREITADEDAPPTTLIVAPEVKKRDEAMFSKEPYMAYMAKAFTKYIVGSEKLPLEIDEVEGPQIGLLPPIVDAYFKQDISKFINPKTPHKLKPDAEGFLRIGVENRARFKSDSFLAAIAPFYMQRSAKEMKALIQKSLQLQPAVFFQLNYGNFLLEYYDLQMKAPPPALLQRWLEGTDINNWAKTIKLPGSFNRTVVERFYISYNNFQGWLDTERGPVKGWIEKEDTLKEYRQLASLLAQPNFILRMPNLEATVEEAQRPGITFIVLDITEDNKLEVRCPPYGFNEGVHGENDIAFLLHHHSGVWEPIFYVDKGGPPTAFFQRGWKKDAEEIGWPSIVKESKIRFEEQCIVMNPGLSYASKDINKDTLVNSSVVYKKMLEFKIEFDGILKDPYNHLTALVFKHPDLDARVAIPCIDDGNIFPATNIYLDWDDLYTASTKDILNFYEKYIVNEREFKNVQGVPLYSPVQVWYEEDEASKKAKIFAIALRNASILPVKTKNPPITLLVEGEIHYYQKDEYKIQAVQKNKNDLEWEINKKLLGLSSDTKKDMDAEETSLTSTDVSDIFEHLRITFAKWLSKKEDGGAIRNKLKEIIYNSAMKLADKRKELYTSLNALILSWFSDQPNKGRPSIQRVDCTASTKDVCSGRCVWTVENKCLIHTPKDTMSIETTPGNKINVDIKYFLFFKLIEELLRFAAKRRELFEDNVSQIGIIDKRIQEGDQEILPENTAAWYERLRGDWVRSTEEKPKFFEEMSISPSHEVPAANEDTSLPDPLAVYLGKDDPHTKSLRILRGTSTELLSIIGYTGDIQLPMDQSQIKTLSDTARISVGQIDLRSDPNPTGIFKQYLIKTLKSQYFILVLLEEGPVLLVKNPITKKLPAAYELPLLLRDYFAVKKGGRQTRRKSRS